MLDYKHWITDCVAHDDCYVTKDILNLMIDKIHHYVFHTSALEFDYEESTFKEKFNKMLYVTYYLNEPEDFKLIKILIEKLGIEKSWMDYTNYIIDNDLGKINNNNIRNEGLLKSLKKD